MKKIFDHKLVNPNKASAFLFVLVFLVAFSKGYSQPTGALSGLFSINETQQVYFSQGNLQYQASTNTWRFAEHQWDYVGGTYQGEQYGTVSGSSNNSISSTYSGWIDLFGWGTSGWNSGSACYQPWQYSSDWFDFHPGGINSPGLVGNYANADWGVYNAISNGGNQPGLWRTLTRAEWEYLLTQRNTLSGARWAFAVVNGVNGVILLPDDWNTSYYNLNIINDFTQAFYTNNTISSDTWTSVLSPHGAVFLPAACWRAKRQYYPYGTCGEIGQYWSSTPWGNGAATFTFGGGNCSYCSVEDEDSSWGLSVRLVRQATNSGYSISTSCSPSNGGTVTGGGNYQQGQTCTLTATPNTGYSFVRWTRNGSQVSTNTTYTFTVTGSATYVAEFQQNIYTISASANPSAGGTVSGTGTYEYGSFCTLNATTNTGYFFVDWTENGNQVSTSSNYSFTVTGNRNLVAKFSQGVNLKYDLYDSNGDGWNGNQLIICDETKGMHYLTLENGYSTSYTLSTPNNSYIALLWNMGSKTEECSFTISYPNGNVIYSGEGANLNSNFYQSLYINYDGSPATTYTINVSANPSNGGSVSGGGTYQQGSYRTVTATANSGYSFSNWTENGNVVSTSASYSFTLTGNRNLVANFTANPVYYSINVSANPTNGGTVSGGGSYQQGSYRTVTATANSGYSFSNWTENGNVVSTSASYSFTLTGNRNLVANFTTVLTVPSVEVYEIFGISPYSVYIRLRIINDGGSTVTHAGVNMNTGSYGILNPSEYCILGISGLTPNTTYTVQPYAENSQGTGYGPSVSFTTLPADYTYMIATSSIPAEGGTVTGGGAYHYNETCTLTATANEGYSFSYYFEPDESILWTENPVIIQVRGDRNFVAHFTPNSYTISASANPSAGGSVSGAGTYNYGSSCTLTATANSGYTFTNWTENGNVVSTSTNYTFTVTGNRSLVANFTESSPIVPTGDLVAYYPFNGNANDYSGNGNHGTIIGNVVPAMDRHGNPNGAYYFPGEPFNYISVPDAEILHLNSFTLSAWVYSDADNYGSGVLINKGRDITNGSYRLNVKGVGAQTQYNGVNGAGIEDDPVLGQWHMVTGTVEGNQARYYLDGVLLTEATLSQSFSYNNTQPLTFGVHYYEGVPSNWAYTLLGVLDEVRIYNRALSSQEVMQLYDSNGEGCLSGVFSVSENSYVSFSQGNLQYQASTNTWRFASNQYDYVGADNANISATNSGWIDLFGWGTSGYNHGAVCYQPWSTSTSYSDYYVYGSSTYNLYDQTGLADWGCNPIANGGNTMNSGWRTLTKDEWTYLFNTRNTTSGILYVRAKVNNINGVILLPDNWPASIYTLNNANGGSYSSNTITADDWANIFEANGAVFLPVAGYRSGTSVSEFGYNGDYWSATRTGMYSSYSVYFSSSSMNTSFNDYRYGGLSVRLVRSAQNVSLVTATANPTEGGVVSGGGPYTEGTECTLTATPNDGYAFTNWTENGNVVSTNANYTFTVSGNRTLVANFTAVEPFHAVFFGTNTNGYVPIEGFWADYYLKSETVYPASEISEMAGYPIRGLNFFASQTDVSWGNANYQVFLKEVENNTISAFTGMEGATIVYEGPLSINGGTMEIVFTTPYLYNGGNLLVGVYNTAEGTYIRSSWYGQTVQGASVQGHNSSSLDAVTPTQRNFIPTTAFVFRSGVDVSLVIATANPSEGGVVSGEGAYATGTECTLTATPNDGYAFANWTENGNVVSTNANYTFTVSGNRTLVANFTTIPVDYTISISADPSEGGTVSGGGTYTEGTECTLTATANTGFTFANWTENGNVVSTNASYTFTVSGDRNLVANFTDNDPALAVFLGTNTNGYVPIEGLYADYYLKSETVYPASEISEMAGRTIRRLKFFASQTDVSWGNANFQVFLKEVDNNTISAFTGMEGATIVYEGPLSINGGTMEIVFTTPYQYNGGNLLMGVYNTAEGTYVRSYWYGQTVQGASVQGHNSSSLDAVTPTQRNFIPTTIFVFQYGVDVSLVTTTANPSEGGTVSGEGAYATGTECTLTATANEGYVFVNWTKNGEVVSTDNPLVFTVTEDADYVANFELNIVTQNIDLHEGWNWVSTYIDMNTVDGLTKIKEALGDNAQTIQTFDNFAENFGGGEWFGLEDYTLTNQEMVMIDAVNDCQIALEGLAVDPSTVTITIKPQEWTWIGFPVNSTTDLLVALNGFEPEFDDIIQGFAGFVSYFGDADGWIGDFAELEPGQGYMYFSNSTTPKILIFRTGAKARTEGK